MNIPGAYAAQLQNAVDTLADALTLEENDPCPGSHTVIWITGVEADEAVAALGTYLTGLIAGLVAVDLAVTERYFGVRPDDAEQLRREVERVAGP